MVQRRKVLAGLTRTRLIDLARALGVPGLGGKSKDEIIRGMATARSVKTRQVLEAMTRDELKAACRAMGFDDGGRAKGDLVARLLGVDGRASGDFRQDKQAESPKRVVAGMKAGDGQQGDRGMAKKKASDGKRKIEPYQHTDKTRVNNPPVGLVTPQTDPEQPKRAYQYDPHIDPSLQWAGKAEHGCFEVPTVSLHVHERIDPRTIIRAVQKRNGNGGGSGKLVQRSLFEEPEQNPPLREAIEFYKHAHGWTNRLIAGDSLLVMNSLLEKEGMAGKVQMIYIDPPYGIEYASNFQPFTNNRTVKERDQDLTHEPEMLRAFRDTWVLGIHSYLAYLRDRVLLGKQLLRETGSIFIQIGVENVHLVRTILDEIFGAENFLAQISFRKKMMPLSKKPGCESMVDYLLWYAKSRTDAEPGLHQLFLKQVTEGDSVWGKVEMPNSTRRDLTDEEINNHRLLPKGSRVYQTISMKPREYREGQDFNFTFNAKVYPPPGGHVDKTPDGVHCWSTTHEGMKRLANQKRIEVDGNTLRYVLFHDDYPVVRLTAHWGDTAPAAKMRYVVETSPLVVERCILMATNPGDLVLDPTCGSGTTAFVAEKWGRRWITCDSSRVAITLAKQRLMIIPYSFYRLAKLEEGVASGFDYRRVPHLTLGALANSEPVAQETLYDSAIPDNSKARVTGPFTIEAVPAPAVRPITELLVESQRVSLDEQPTLTGVGDLELQPRLQFTEDVSVARFGETLRQRQWRDELLACGIRGKGGQRIQFARLEPLGATRWLQCEGETKGERVERVVVSFGPEHAPLEQRQVELALEEAVQLKPTPKVVIFAAFQFDPEAAKDIDETKWPGVTLLKAQMNTDLLTDDLKKKRSSNESYWLMGQPDVELRQIAKGEHKGKCQVEVHGFDYYNPRTGAIESGDTTKIAMWMLDTDYDGRSLFPRQVFFPMAGPKDGWARLAKNLKAEIDEDLIEAYRGTVSLPFERGDYRRVAVKIVDDRGIESLKIVEVM